jgi:hypothetical protein
LACGLPDFKTLPKWLSADSEVNIVWNAISPSEVVPASPIPPNAKRGVFSSLSTADRSLAGAIVQKRLIPAMILRMVFIVALL